MVHPFKFLSAFFIVAVIASACNSSSTKSARPEYEGGYRYVPLKDFKYAQADIQPGTEVEILSNMGGRANSRDTVYYYEFFVRNKETMETIRVLCPVITIDVDAGPENKTSTTPLAYDPDKGVTTAFFQHDDSTGSLLLSGENLERIISGTNAAEISHLLDATKAVRIVAQNKEEAGSRILKYRTTTGVLNFKSIPW